MIKAAMQSLTAILITQIELQVCVYSSQVKVYAFDVGACIAGMVCVHKQ